MAKPLPALGLVIGVVATYLGVRAASYATGRLTMRFQTLRGDVGAMLPWLALLVVIAVLLGLLMIAPRIGAGVTTGAGLLLTVVGLAVMLLPVRQAFDLVKLFQLPGSRFGPMYLLFDGSVLLIGIPLLLVGIRRWAQESKLAKQAGPQSTYPQQQWGGYPGQQPYQPPQHAPQHQPQQQPYQQPYQQPQYPGQQDRPNQP
ncbi:hypothetical protein [Kribbella sp. NPDC048915]|uniref:hypothetical protein n=1 Tax=Kribbella sp. NPDC048915 TaxID=3155148 RepID=UPI0033D4958C